MEIMLKEELLKLQNGTEITLPLLIKEYTTGTTKNGSPYFSGVAESRGSVPFKVWSGGVYEKLNTTSYRGKVVLCEATVNIYNGTFALILNTVNSIEGYSAVDFLDTPYDTESLYDKLMSLLKANVSETGYSLYEEILSNYLERFKVEVAAVNYHDNFVSGLLAHTYKMCVVLNYSLKMYKTIAESIDKDLIFLAVALHDIGKTVEYSNGSLSEVSYAGHHVAGVEAIVLHRGKIIANYGEKWYYRLLSVITQHHGEFGETPRTVEAVIVHNIDMFESQMQLMNQSLPIKEYTQIGKFKVT